MRIDALRAVEAALALLVITLTPVQAQQSSAGPSLFLVDAGTTVSSLGWSFPSGTDLERSTLRQRIATRGPGRLVWLKKTFDFIPGVPSPRYSPFSPVMLQRDVVRLRRVYREAGFPNVRVDYDVSLDTASNRVAVTMIVDQDGALVVDSVAVRLTVPTGERGPGPPREPADQNDGGGAVSQEAALPADLREEWSGFLESLRSVRGRRYSQEERARLVNRATDWFLDRGYPWASASVEGADTVDSRVRVGLRVVPGARARVAEIRLEGNQRLSRGVLLREIPIRVGDLYDASDVAEGQRELYELDLVRQALGDVVEGQPGDSTVVVRFRVNEGLPRLLWGRVGWRSESGMGGEAHWQHRNFVGGARTFTVSSNFESGWLALEATNTRSIGLSALVRQPYVFRRTVSASFGPFARWRDDFRDRSLLFGVESALIYRRRPLETVTLLHELSRLRVDDTYQLTPIREVVQQGDSVYAPIFVKSVFKMTGAYGTLDDRINPRSGFLLEPNLEVTGPSGVSDVEYFRLGLKGMAVMPLGRDLSLFLRGSAGRLFPFGRSDPETGVSRTTALVGLRDAMFTAGGTSDVRGWGNGLMGSKIPDVSVADDGTVVADRYVPAGGLARLTGTVELGLPFPFLPRPHRTFVFADAGRVWSPGTAFDPGDPELVRDTWAVGAGGGLEIGTLVGPIRLAVGYKLNPSTVDLLSPGAVARALVDGVPLDQLQKQSYRRWHLHLSIGRGL